MKPFKEVPKEKLDDALNKLDIWSLGCVLSSAALRCASAHACFAPTCAQLVQGADAARGGVERGNSRAAVPDLDAAL